ncbi:hypothetical protein R50073_37080 [Maricurvus nonylphenolicus]
MAFPSQCYAYHFPYGTGLFLKEAFHGIEGSQTDNLSLGARQPGKQERENACGHPKSHFEYVSFLYWKRGHNLQAPLSGLLISIANARHATEYWIKSQLNGMLGPITMTANDVSKTCLIIK